MKISTLESTSASFTFCLFDHHLRCVRQPRALHASIHFLPFYPYRGYTQYLNIDIYMKFQVHSDKTYSLGTLSCVYSISSLHV